MKLRTVFRRHTTVTPRMITVASADDRSDEQCEFDRDMWYLVGLRQAIITRAHSEVPRMRPAVMRRMLRRLEVARLHCELVLRRAARGDAVNLATEIVEKRRISGSGAEQRLYRLSAPLVSYKHGYEYVRVSACTVPFSGPEVYIFGSDSDGEITDWCELEGSYRGGLDHAVALANAGYEVAAP
jgi:hypothetical protein